LLRGQWRLWVGYVTRVSPAGAHDLAAIRALLERCGLPTSDLESARPEFAVIRELAVSLVQAIRGVLPWGDAGAYMIVQILGCCLGTVLAHAMFDLPWLQASAHVRTGPGQWLAEGVATFGLILVILGLPRPRDAAWMVAAWIGAAYWFTASTSFANPAITSRAP
jgi:hypothetical protein